MIMAFFVQFRTEYVVVVGDYDYSDDTERETQNFGVLEYIHHPDYTDSNLNTAIALLRLNGTVNFEVSHV